MSLTNLSHRAHTSGNKYFFFELPYSSMIRIGDLNLNNHHISVNASAIGKIDLQSQYHYTAFLENADGEMYLLHVYFNADEGIVAQPFLSRVIGENEFEPVACEEHHLEMELLATRVTQPMIALLRKKQHELTSSLWGRYDTFERSATELSTDLITNKKKYLTLINLQLQLLEQITNISNSINKAHTLLRWFKQVKRTFESQSSEEKKRSALPLGAAASSKSPPSAGLSIFEATDLPEAVKPSGKLAHKQANLTLLLRELRYQLENAKKDSGSALILSVNTLFGKIAKIELEIEIGDYNTRTQDLFEIKTLKTEIERLGKKTLEQSLAKEEYDRASELSCFYSHLTKLSLSDFLSVNNPRLLRFVLSNKIVSPKCGDFSFRGEHYQSVLNYYFRQRSVSPGLIDCLDIVVKNGHSLMELDPKSGLPYAALILLQPSTHPFREILTRNRESTLDNINFYKKLNTFLSAAIAERDFPAARKPAIRKLITKNQSALEKILVSNSLPSFSRTGLAQSIEALQAEAIASYGREQLAQIQSDPQIQALSKLITQRTK